MMFQSRSHFSEFGSIQNVFRFWDLDNKFWTKFQEIREISRNPKGGNRKFRIHELNNRKFLGLGLIFFKPGIGIGIPLPTPGAKGDFFEKKIWEYSLILLLILSRMIVFSTLWRHSLASFAYFKILKSAFELQPKQNFLKRPPAPTSNKVSLIGEFF